MTTAEAPQTDVSSEANEPANSEANRKRILEVLDTLRPYLQADGGDVDLVDVTDDGVVQVKLKGACGTCPSAIYTLKMGIEEQIKHHIPSVKEVISV